MENRKDVTVPMDEKMVELVDSQLEYGDSRAGWIREAVRQRLEREGVEVPEESEGNPSDAAASAD